MSDIDLTDGDYTTVVDSIEDGLATVFFEQGDEEVGNAVIDVDRLPEDGQHADAILAVTIVDGELEHATYDPERTRERKDAAQDRFDRLSKRPPSDDES